MLVCAKSCLGIVVPIEQLRHSSDKFKPGRLTFVREKKPPLGGFSPCKKSIQEASPMNPPDVELLAKERFSVLHAESFAVPGPYA